MFSRHILTKLNRLLTLWRQCSANVFDSSLGALQPYQVPARLYRLTPDNVAGSLVAALYWEQLPNGSRDSNIGSITSVGPPNLPCKVRTT